MIRRHLSTVLGLALCGAICTACERPAETPPPIKPEYDKNTGKLTRLSHDTNGNGKPDTVAVMDGGRVVRVEADEDENGTVDRWEYYTTSPGQTTGAGQPADVLERVERATNRDGRVNRWEFFEAGTLARVKEDTDGDGRVDKWEEYAQGTLTVMALDTVGRGSPDRKLFYTDGNLDRIEVDPDGSGRFQRVKP